MTFTPEYPGQERCPYCNGGGCMECRGRGTVGPAFRANRGLPATGLAPRPVRSQPYNCGPELLAKVIHNCQYPYAPGPYCPRHQSWLNEVNGVAR